MFLGCRPVNIQANKQRFLFIFIPLSLSLELLNFRDDGEALDITGFTIQNGVSDLENITEKPGAGIYCVNASPMLTDCTIKENYAYGDGGGIALLDSSDMIITNIKFQNKPLLPSFFLDIFQHSRLFF